MKRVLILTAAAAMLIACGWANEAMAGGNLKSRVALRQSQTYPWHGDYYDTAWGMPVAVVVPPTAESQMHWGWGVGATRVTPIQHQFQRNYPGPGVVQPLVVPSHAALAVEHRSIRRLLHSRPVVNLSPCGANNSVLLCQPGQSDRRAVLFLFL